MKKKKNSKQYFSDYACKFPFHTFKNVSENVSENLPENFALLSRETVILSSDFKVLFQYFKINDTNLIQNEK